MEIAPNTHDLQKHVDYALANLKQNAPDIHAKMSWHLTDMVMSSRLRRCAGQCTYWRNSGELKLEFSATMFDSFPEMEKTDTVIHEMAHAICFRLGYGKGHGHTFKRMCRLMGGTGERLVKAGVGVVKRNLIKRWVLARKSDPSKLAIRTRKQADNYLFVFPDSTLLGVIQVDPNTKRCKWLSVRLEVMRGVNPLEGKYQLVA